METTGVAKNLPRAHISIMLDDSTGVIPGKKYRVQLVEVQ